MDIGRSRIPNQLNRVLDGYGFSRSFIDYRRRASNLFHPFPKADFHMMCVGSKRDALCSFFDTESDLDGIFFLPVLTFDESSLDAANDFVSSKANLKLPVLLLESGPNHGYKYLQCLSYGSQILPKDCTKFRGGIYFLNTYKQNSLPANQLDFVYETHGPAVHGTVLCDERENISLEVDAVLALHCPFLPFEFNEWCNRKRNYKWPPEWIIEATKKYGCLVVAVGHKSSDTEALEWRLSLTKTECLLTKSFNHVQMKCYVLMKLVLKWIIQPQMKEPLSSYHVKTVMFWMSEERERDFWRPENLTGCFISSLMKLKSYVENKNCPSYFMTNVNLLEGKLEGDIHKEILEILGGIIAEGPTVVYRCLPLNVQMNDVRCEHLNGESCECLHKYLLYKRIKEIDFICTKFRDEKSNIPQGKELYTTSHFCLRDWHAINEIQNGSLCDSITFSAMSVCEEMVFPNKLIYSLQKEIVSKLRVNGYVARIKLATIFYYRRRLGYCVPLLSFVIKSMEASQEFELCTQGDQVTATHPVNIEGIECVYLTQNNKGFQVSEIVFSPCDQLLIPPDLQNEMKRPKTVNGTHYEGWVFVDSIVYAYYLLIVTLHDMRRYSGITSLFRRFHKVYTQQPGAIRIFRKEMAKRLYEHAFMLVWAATKGFTKLSV